MTNIINEDYERLRKELFDLRFEMVNISLSERTEEEIENQIKSAKGKLAKYIALEKREQLYDDKKNGKKGRK